MPRPSPATSRWFAAAAALLLCGAGLAHDVPQPKLDFQAPAPGTYRLERIMPPIPAARNCSVIASATDTMR